MMNSSFLFTLFKTALVLLFVDVFWLLTGGIFARSMTERIQGQPISLRFVGAGLVYFFLAYMLLETRSYQQAFMYGLCIYAVYDLTNYAVFAQYDWKFAIADSLWGGVLFMGARYMLKNIIH
jgi:uncharacterized membrane protein